MIILLTDDYILGDTNFCVQSPRTLDIKFQDLCNNLQLQKRMHLASVIYLEPMYSWQEPRQGEKLYEFCRFYLSAFRPTNKEQD